MASTLKASDYKALTDLVVFRKGTRPHSKDEAQTWEIANIANTLNVFDVGEVRASELVVKNLSVRRLTPMECERLQGYPDGWTDIGPWTDSAGKLHKESADSARYKALGNSIALPSWGYVLTRLSLCVGKARPTMASLFDGIGGFPLIWEYLNGTGSCRWASEIEEFPIAVTKLHFPEEDTRK